MGLGPEVPLQTLLVVDWAHLPYAARMQPLMCPTYAVAQEKGVAPVQSAGWLDHRRHFVDSVVV